MREGKAYGCHGSKRLQKLLEHGCTIHVLGTPFIPRDLIIVHRVINNDLYFHCWYTLSF